MALSGSVSVAGTPNVALVFNWAAVQDKAAKKSTVNWQTQLVSNNIGHIEATPGSAYDVTVDGQEFNGTTDISIETNSTKTLAEGTVVLEHNEDGTKSFDFTFSQDFHITVGDGYVGVVSGSGTGELDAIAEDSGDTGDTTDPTDPGNPDDPEETANNFDLRSWLTGYILGISGKPYPLGGRQWETLFDGEVTTTESGAYPGLYSASLGVRNTNLAKHTYRVTIDNVAYTETSYGSLSVGNMYLLYPENYEDTGQDFVLNGITIYFYTRTPGTYTLKLERLVETDG